MSYIFRDEDLRTTSLGMSAKGVLETGGVNAGGGNPGGTFTVKEPKGKGGVLVALPSIPAARNLSSNELGSGTGVEDAGGLVGCAIFGGDKIRAGCGGGTG